MRRPNGEWTTELARESGYQNGPTLPADAQKAITLQMYARDGQLRGALLARRRADLDRDRRRFLYSGLANAGIGLSAYNGTGNEIGTFEAFTVGEPPDLPRPRRRARPRTRPRPATRCCSTARTPRSTLEVRRWRALRPRGLHDQVGRRVRPAVHTKQDYEAPYSLKLEWMMPGDDNSGVFVGFPDTGANTDQTSISQGEEIQIDPTDNPAQTTGAIYLEQAADAAARDAALKPPGQWNEYEIVVRTTASSCS